MQKKMTHQIFVFVLAIFLSFQAGAQEIASQDFSFIISSDQRDHASELFHSKVYTQGGYEAIKEIGKGSFMVVVGDLDPVHATDNLIAKVLGEDYPWYPVVGNHDIENPEDLAAIKSMNDKAHPLPKVVNRGPVGCEETNYAFDWYGVHFVVIDVFYEKTGVYLKYTPIADGILDWLEDDLKQNQGKRIFVFGHKPVFAFPDMDNGTRRHLGEVLDRYPENELRLQQMLMRYGVTAYIGGHTHAASWANVNGVWHLNSGHIYGQETDYTIEKLYSSLSKFIEKAGMAGVVDTTTIRKFYNTDAKEMRRIFFWLNPVPGKTYKIRKDQETMNDLYRFYQDCLTDRRNLDDYSSLFWKNVDWRKSTFMKVKIQGGSAVLEIYRDKDFTGDYELRHTQILY